MCCVPNAEPVFPDKQSSQKYKYISLNQSIENIEVQAECHWNDRRYNDLDQFHNDKCTQYIPKKSHAKRQRLDKDFQNINGGDDRHRFCKTFYPAFHTFLMNACVLNEHNAHDGKSCCHIQILCWRFNAKKSDKVRTAYEQKHRSQIWHISFTMFTKNPREKIL